MDSLNNEKVMFVTIGLMKTDSTAQMVAHSLSDAQGIFQIVLVGQFQDGLVRDLAKPNDSFAGQLVVPLAARYHPRFADTRQAVSSREVEMNMCVRSEL